VVFKAAANRAVVILKYPAATFNSLTVAKAVE
jgi:hypothetical protein